MPSPAVSPSTREEEIAKAPELAPSRSLLTGFADPNTVSLGSRLHQTGTHGERPLEGGTIVNDSNAQRFDEERAEAYDERIRRWWAVKEPG